MRMGCCDADAGRAKTGLDFGAVRTASTKDSVVVKIFAPDVAKSAWPFLFVGICILPFSFVRVDTDIGAILCDRGSGDTNADTIDILSV